MSIPAKKRPRLSANATPIDPVLGVLASRLKAFRLAAGMTQEELADAAEIERTRVGKIERGQVNPSVLTVATLCHCLGISLASLFAEVNIAKKPVSQGGTPRRANQASLSKTR